MRFESPFSEEQLCGQPLVQVGDYIFLPSRFYSTLFILQKYTSWFTFTPAGPFASSAVLSCEFKMAESMSQMEQFTSTLASLQSSHHHSSSSSSSLNHSGHSLTGHHTSGHHSGSGNHHHHSSSSSSGRHGGSSRSSQSSSSRSNPNHNSFGMHHHVKSSSSSHGHGQQQLYGSGSSSVAFPTSQRVIHTNNGLGHQQATIMQLQQQSNNRNHLVPTSIAFPSFNHHQQSNAAVQLLQLPIINTIQQQPIQVQSSSSSSKSSRNQSSNQQMTVQIQQLQQINNGSGQAITLSSIGGHGSSSAAAPAAPAAKKPKKKYPKKKPETAAYNPYQDPTSDYSPHCPKAWNRKVTGQVFCRGCGKAFLKYSNGLYEKGYYVHCIKECREYRDLDMVKSCHDCRHLFINKKSFSQHPCEKAKKKELKEMKSMAQA